MKLGAKRIFGGLLRLVLLYLLLPLLLIALILIQTAVPRLLFQWQPFATAALIWLAVLAAVAYHRKTRIPLIWGGVSLAYAAAFFASLLYAVVIAGSRFSGIPLLIAFAFLAGAINFLYRNRVSEPLLVLLPVCAAAWSFIVLLYQPCFVVWAILASGTGDMMDALRILFVEATTSVLTLAVVVFPTMVMYFLGKHAYVDAYGWAKGKLTNIQNKEDPV